MDTTTFLRGVLGDAGYYCAMAIKDGRRTQKFYPTIEQLENAASNMDENGYDVYFGLGTFKDPSVEKPREAANVQQMRAFFMDLDCGVNLKDGKPKDFPDQATAIAELKEFVKRNELPRPFLVNSGYGVHVYWMLRTPIDVETWVPVAEKLKALAKAQGFKADPNVTADAARILRVPGTHNYKSGSPVPVRFFGTSAPSPVEFMDFSGRINAKSSGMMPVPSKRAYGSLGTNSMMDALLGNRTASFREILRKTAEGKGCAQLAFAVQNSDSLTEPQWRAALSVAQHCEDSDKAIHVVSRGHPEYDPEEAYAKASRIKGPYTCEKFEEHNPGGCVGCPFIGKIRSPIAIGSKIKEAAPQDNVVEIAPDVDDKDATPIVFVIPPYPNPYFRGAHGGVYQRAVDDDGEVTERVVWHNDLYVTRRLNDPEQGEVVEMRHHLPRDGVKTFVVPLYVVTSKDEFRKALSLNGVAAINKEVDAIMAYTQSWVKELQYTTQADDAHRQFGWLPEFKGFVLGDKVIYGNKVELNAPSASTRAMMGFFETKGTLEEWKEAINFYNRPGFELHQFIACAGFGSALMKFLPINASLLHIWSKDSGFGKTHAQYAALSPWGNPRKLITKQDDTYNSFMNRADVMHSLPVCMDEITNIHPKEASDLIYQITGGQQKNRMSSNGNTERYRGDPWNLLFITSANCSLIDKVCMAKAMPKAEAQRVLEIETSKLFTQKSDKVFTDEFSVKLQNNYGHAGILFVQYVMDNMAETRILVETLQRRIDKAADLGSENRFWSAAAAATMAAAVICKHLGLIEYNVQNLQNYVIKTILGHNKSAAMDMAIDPMDLVTEYTYKNFGRILQIKSTIDRRSKKDSNGIDDLVVPDQQPRTADIVGRYETDLHILYLLPAPFKEWLAERQINYTSVIGELKKSHNARRVKVRLTKGTKLQMPVADVIEIPISLEDGDGKAAE